MTHLERTKKAHTATRFMLLTFNQIRKIMCLVVIKTEYGESGVMVALNFNVS